MDGQGEQLFRTVALQHGVGPDHDAALPLVVLLKLDHLGGEDHIRLAQGFMQGNPGVIATGDQQKEEERQRLEHLNPLDARRAAAVSEIYLGMTAASHSAISGPSDPFSDPSSLTAALRSSSARLNFR